MSRDMISRTKAIEAIVNLTEEDAPEIIRCRDCKYSEPLLNGKCLCGLRKEVRRMDWYCADAVKEGGND